MEAIVLCVLMGTSDAPGKFISYNSYSKYAGLGLWWIFHYSSLPINHTKVDWAGEINPNWNQ